MSYLFYHDVLHKSVPENNVVLQTLSTERTLFNEQQKKAFDISDS